MKNNSLSDEYETNGRTRKDFLWMHVRWNEVRFFVTLVRKHNIELCMECIYLTFSYHNFQAIWFLLSYAHSNLRIIRNLLRIILWFTSWLLNIWSFFLEPSGFQLDGYWNEDGHPFWTTIFSLNSFIYSSLSSESLHQFPALPQNIIYFFPLPSKCPMQHLQKIKIKSCMNIKMIPVPLWRYSSTKATQIYIFQCGTPVWKIRIFCQDHPWGKSISKWVKAIKTDGWLNDLTL